MQNYLWLLLTIFSTAFAFHYCYLLIIKRQMGRIVKQNLNVEKVTTSPGGIPMVWISENEFFIDIEVDRNISWKELIRIAQLDLAESSTEIGILKLMPKLDIPEKRTERLYFKNLNLSAKPLVPWQVIDLFKPDPFALITLLVKEKEFFIKYNSYSIWERKNSNDNPCILFVNSDSLHGCFLARNSSVNSRIQNRWMVGRKD